MIIIINQDKISQLWVRFFWSSSEPVSTRLFVYIYLCVYVFVCLGSTNVCRLFNAKSFLYK